MSTLAPDQQELVRARIREMVAEAKAAQTDPADWLRFTEAVDPKTGEEFYFHFDDGWEWQREELDVLPATSRSSLRLKARQLGVSWLGIGYCVWKCLTSPGTRALCVSINETEAVKLINRAWDLWENSPEHLRFDAKVIKPQKGRPSTRIEWEFPDGKISSLLAMPSTPRAGHGETAALVFLDEFARHQYAEESWKAFIPVIADGGQILIVSTANGYGNTFYDLWIERRRARRPRDVPRCRPAPRPRRSVVRAMRKTLSTADMAEQYPLNAAEAFLGTAGCWFDTEALACYAEKRARAAVPLRLRPGRGRRRRRRSLAREDGWIRVYDQPDTEKEYAIYADVATGRGKDYTAAVVIDLTNMNIAAELHGKIDPDLFAEQLHFLGRWYNTARIALEMGGGYGEPVIISLRDGQARGASRTRSSTATSRTTGPTSSRTSPTASRSRPRRGR